MDVKRYDAIIIGGSYSGLSAAMTLGRSMRQVLVIDSGNPCNIQTPYSHNFLTQDGQSPHQIHSLAYNQVQRYKSVKFHQDVAINVVKKKNGIEVLTVSGNTFFTRKLIFATGLKDLMPAIQGFPECWGISILHCPYCHGYEVKNVKTGILANGETAFHLAQLVSNWTKELTLFTNGTSLLTEEQRLSISKHKIQIIEDEIDFIEHNRGEIQNLVFENKSKFALNALYAKPAFVQHSDIPQQLGCEITEQGLIKVDAFQKTTIDGVFACGDNSGRRAVSVAVSSGTLAGIFLNKELIEEDF